jgi:hypothetical protein
MIGALLGTVLVAPGAAQAGAATTAAPVLHDFSCAIAWDPTIPRATGQIDGNGVPRDLVIHGGTGMDYRVIYYLNGIGTPSAIGSKYRKTPKVWDFYMTRPITPTPVLWQGAFQVSRDAGKVPTWPANILVWPTSVPARPNAVCTTLN